SACHGVSPFDQRNKPATSPARRGFHRGAGCGPKDGAGCERRAAGRTPFFASSRAQAAMPML
ncbi:MAG: hypothetical protein AB7G39_18595, partial [Alphaproteobacteria bacterium]